MGAAHTTEMSLSTNNRLAILKRDIGGGRCDYKLRAFVDGQWVTLLETAGNGSPTCDKEVFNDFLNRGYVYLTMAPFALTHEAANEYLNTLKLQGV